MALAHLVRFVLLLCILCTLPLTAATQTTKTARVALLIGNASYKVGPLRNPPNDVQQMDAALRSLGFDTQRVLNANQAQMKRALRDFGVRAQGADIALLYYSGHGTQVAGENYLIPVQAAIESEGDYEIEAVSANAILRQLAIARPRVTLVVLDACRDNPMAATSKSGTKGLSRMEAPTGTLIAFATAQNTTASDDGHYARVLSAELRKPGQELLDAFRNTTAEVRRLTQGRQDPRVSEVSIAERVYLAGAPNILPPANPGTARTLPLTGDAALLQAAHVMYAEERPDTLARLRRLATSGNPFAPMMVARLYEMGRLVPRDPAQAELWRAQAAPNLQRLHELARQGQTAALAWLANLDRDSKDPQRQVKALERFRQAAQSGDPYAQRVLGLLLWENQSTPTSTAEGTQWLTRAAEAGDAEAMVLLAEQLLQNPATGPAPDAALRWLQRAMNTGNARALMLMGALKWTGDRFPKDEPAAIALLEEAAALGSAEAMFGLGQYFWQGGQGLAKDAERAVHWWRRASEFGEPRAQWRLGHALLEGNGARQNRNEGMALIRRAAEAGFERAMFSLAMELNGTNQQPVTLAQKQEALAWLHKAADAGSALAAGNLARQYRRGEGVPRDLTKAFAYAQQAAAPTDAFGADVRLLAEMHLAGEGTPKSPEQAMALFERAAKGGDTVAMRRAGQLRLEDGQEFHDLSKAHHWLKRAAEDADPESMAFYGALLMEQASEPSERRTARDWMRRAHEAKEPWGTYYWATALQRSDLGEPPQPQQATTLLRQAADGGLYPAMLALGMALHGGQGVAADPSAGTIWFRRAAEGGWPAGMFLLGMAYEHGEGVTRDLAQARYWVHAAARAGNVQAVQWLQQQSP
jgi:TPR repeat protein